jgi:hypothetical protein
MTPEAHADVWKERLAEAAWVTEAIRAAVAEEREACAKIADAEAESEKYGDSHWEDVARFHRFGAENVAHAIRARGGK